MSKRRKFSVEFTRGAVEQASPPGVTCAQVAREPGIRGSLLTRWKREAQSPGAIAFGGSRFRSSDYQGYLAANGLVCSMIAVGHCGDNAACEGFFCAAEARADLSNELPHIGCSKSGCV